MSTTAREGSARCLTSFGFSYFLYTQESKAGWLYLILFPVCPCAALNKLTLIFVCRLCGSTSVGGFEAEVGGLTFCCWEIACREGCLSCCSQWHFHWTDKHLSWDSTFKTSPGWCPVVHWLISWLLCERPVLHTAIHYCNAWHPPPSAKATLLWRTVLLCEAFETWQMSTK